MTVQSLARDRLVRRALSIYLAVRAFGAVVVLYATARQHASFSEGIRVWDGHWYLEVFEHGYPVAVASPSQPASATIAFFPGFPWTARVVEAVTRLPAAASLFVVVFLAGAVATVALALLVRDVLDEPTALRSVLLFCVFPGAFVLDLLYSEPLMIAAVLVCFLALERRAWMIAGVAGALAAFTRPTGIAIVAACGWMAIVAVRRRREWRAMWSIALASLGAIAYHAYLWHHTGEARVYFRVQREQFLDEPSLGRDLWYTIRHAFAPVTLSHRVILLVALAFIVVAGTLLIRSSLPFAMKLYTAAVLLLPVVFTSVGPRPRYVWVAFPLIVAVAARLSGRWFVAVTVLSTCGLAVLLTLYVQRSPEISPYLFVINPSP